MTTFQTIANRAYEIMAQTEAKFGHGSAPHCVAWTVFADARAIIAKDNVPLAFSNEFEMQAALELVQNLVAARRPSQKLVGVVADMARRPHSMGPFQDVR
jgi:hypothetical protein